MTNEKDDTVARIQARMAGGEHFGDIIWFSARDVEGVTRAEVARLLTAAGLDAYGLAPDQPTPWKAMSKARATWRRERRQIQIDKERKDQRHSPWLITHRHARSYDPLACVAVDTDTGDFLVEHIAPKAGVVRDPTHEQIARDVVAELRDSYEAHFRYVSTGEVRAIVNEAILGCWGGTRLKEDGHLYWLPAASGRQAELRRLGEDVVGRIGRSYLRLLELNDSSANTETVAEGAREAFESEITKLLKEVRGEGAKLTVEKSRESSFEDRLAAYEELRHRIDLYSNILGEHQADLLRDLDEATDIVTEMLAGASARREARRQRAAVKRARARGATEEEIDAMIDAFDGGDDDAAPVQDAPTAEAEAAMSRSEARRARRAAKASAA